MKQSNWDDDFDFDDDAPKKKPVVEKKKNVKDNDFFDDQENTNKLPSIGSKNNISKQLTTNNKRGSARINPYADNMKLRGNVYDDDQNIYEDMQEVSKNKNNSNNKDSKDNKKKQVEEDMEYYQEIDQEPKKQVKKDNKKSGDKIQSALQRMLSKHEQEEEYNEEIADDGYGDDFEQVVQEPKYGQKKIPPATDPPNKKTVTSSNKIQTTKQNDSNNNNNKNALNVNVNTNTNTNANANANSNANKNVGTNNNKASNAPPKPPSRASQASKPEPAYRNMTLQKNQKPTIPRSESRKSLKSAQSKNRSRVVSNNKFATNTSFIPNKYSTQIDKTFPQINLNQMNQDKINKLNDRLRAMIKKFNQELNQLINKNMLYLKAKKNQKSVNVQTKLKVLEEQSKNNQTMIDVMQKQYDKLAGRDGQLRQQQYQLMTQKRIQQMKQQIKQTQKAIVKFKTQIKSEGNKLTNKNQDKKLAAQIHHLKTTLIQTKKDQQKQHERIQKLDQQMQDLSTKITDIDYKLSQLVDQAKEKGIQLQSRQEIIKKFETIKKKVQSSKNHRVKLENLIKTKSDIVSHEKQQMKINIKNCELEIKNLYDSISHVHNQSIKVVEKARTNPKLPSNLVADLDSILKSLQLVQMDNYSVRSQQNKSQHSQRPLKNIAGLNMQKSQPHKRSQSANNDKHITGLSVNQDSSKPNLMKKKPKVNQMPEQKKGDAYQRVWRDEEKQKPKKQEIKVAQPAIAKQKEPEKPVQEQKDKKKPFTLKKNRVSAENKAGQKEQVQPNKNQKLKIQLQIEKKQQQQKKQDKKQQISLAGPKMIKFRKKANQEPSKQLQKQNKQEQKPKLILQNKVEEEIKNQEQKPSFVPKRFNLRKQQKKQDSYVPSIENRQKQQPKKQIKVEPQIQKKSQQYKPKLNFGDVQDNFKKPTYDPFDKKPQAQTDNKPIAPIIEDKKEDQQKPKFNLRLRDRKKNNQDVGYLPSTTTQNKVVEEKPIVQQKDKQIVINKNNPPPQNNTNPYAPKENIKNISLNSNNTNITAQPPKFNLIKDTSNQNLPKEQNQPQQEVSPPNNPYNPYIQNQGEGRKKEGPVKKPKIQQPVEKKKFNIYEQAQEAQGLNQFVNQPKIDKKQPQNNFNPIATKDLNLNDLLGVKNKKNNDDLADLIGGGNATKKPKKHNDFFGDLDI